MLTRRDFVRLLSVPLLPAASTLALASPAPYRERRLVMGTIAEVAVWGAPSPLRAVDLAYRALDAVDAAMSLWHESELTRLNASGDAVVSADLALVMAQALAIASASSGAFDPTVEPLVRATGGVGGPRRRPPTGGRGSLLRRVGYRRVTLDRDTRRVRLSGGSRLDLGGIAKGFAADRALAEIRRAGASGGWVSLGESSVKAFGRPLALTLRDPERRGQPWAFLELNDAATASSGNDQKPDHIFDPHTGRPARGPLALTVIGVEAMLADGLSTAAYVLGEREGLALIHAQGYGGLMLLRDRGRRVVLTTPGLTGRLALTVAPDVLLRAYGDRF